jgi:arsenate reductase-like glutaredoxin family protein
MLDNLLARMGKSVRSVMRKKGTLYADLGLADTGIIADAQLDAMVANPGLIDRSIVVTPRGVGLCRPSEAVIDLLPPQRDEFHKEDGQVVVHAEDTLVAP